MHPIGWDAFGLPAENAAIKRGVDPAAWTYENIATQKSSMRRYACSFDWDRVLNTCDPEFYRWNQWFFLRLLEKGLAYRKPSQVNWCPKDQTVLANEQVVGGLCERCDTPVTKKKLTQWYFRITEYADRLLDDMEQLEGSWPDKVLTMQRNWIGRSTGADVAFRIEGRDEPVTVYTTRPDTLFGATFFVVAADSDLAAELAAGSPPEVQEQFASYVDQVRLESEIDRLSTDRPKTGVFLERLRGQPGQRRAAAGLRVGLRAGRLRPRRDHGGAGARPARPGLRPGLRPAGADGRGHRRGGPGHDRRRHHRRRDAGELRTARRHGQGGGDRPHRGDTGRAGWRPGRGQLPAARLADLAAAVLGDADPRSSTARRAARSRSPTTSCP